MPDPQPPTLTPDAAVIAARSHWQFTGTVRPPFAETPKEGQRSVWDFPRPPAIQPISDPVEVRLDDEVIAKTSRAVEVLETSHAPTIYIPPGDFEGSLVSVSAIGGSHCEWKGISRALAVRDVADAGWMIVQAYPEFAGLVGWAAFYPTHLTCLRNSQRVGAQGGGYYGGWVTPDLAGPIKGGPGSGGW